MKSATLVVIVLAVLTHVAVAQPGATQPSQPQPPPVDVQAGAQANTDSMLDQAVASAHAAAPRIISYAKGTLRRARRAIAFGPTVGLYGVALPSPGEADAALTFGLGIEKFDVPILPEAGDIQDQIVERAKAEAKERAKQVFAGRNPDPVELNQFATQVYNDVRKQFLDVEATKFKTLEKPSFTLALEADRRFAADRWLGRARIGFGVSIVTLGVSASFGRACRGDGCNDSVHAFLGPEVVVHLQTSKEPRSNVVDGFARFDYQATGRSGTTYDQIVLGARFMLDAI